jgi:uncharacterized ubiquitin-like protein YukD
MPQGQTIVHNAPTTIVFARKEHLGITAVEYANKNSFVKPTLEISEISESVMDVEVFPNPFQHNAQIKISLLEDSHVQVELFTVTGSKIKVLNNNYLIAGNHNFNFGINDKLEYGVYILRVTRNEQVLTRRIVHIME